MNNSDQGLFSGKSAKEKMIAKMKAAAHKHTSSLQSTNTTAVLSTVPAGGHSAPATGVFSTRATDFLPIMSSGVLGTPGT